MNSDQVEISIDEVVGWAIDQGAFLPPEIPCTWEDAIEITRFFYSNLRALAVEAEDFSVFDHGFDSVIREGAYLREICSDSGIALPPDSK